MLLLMLLNMFFIYLVALATEAAAFSSKRVGRMAADKTSLSNVGEVEKRNALHYTGQNGRESQYIDAEGGLNYQAKARIRRRGPPLQKRRQKIHTKVDKIQPCSAEGCELPLGSRRHDSPVSIATAPLFEVGKEEIGASNLLPQITSEEIAKVVRDNMQHAIKHRSLGNEENPVEELKGEAVGNKLLDQSPEADGDDDYGQAQEEMTQNGVKSSIEEADAIGEQILRPSEENLALAEKRHKRKYELYGLDTLARVAGKQTEEGRLNSKKQLLVHENEAKYEEGKRRCCNKYPNYGKNKLFYLNNNEMTDATEEDKEYGQDTQAVVDEETVSEDSEDAEEQEAVSEDNPSEVESGDNKIEEGNLHKIEQRSESLEDKCPGKQAQKEQKAQKLASGYENKQPLKGLSKTRRTARGAARKEGQQKKNTGNQGFLSPTSMDLNKLAGHFYSNGDDRKSSLNGRSEGEEGGERDEEETLESENVEDVQESNDRVSVLGNKNDQQQAFDQDKNAQNLEEQPAINEQNDALEGDEVQEEESKTKYESRQAAVEEQGAEESNLEEPENEENQSEESETPKKRQVTEGGLKQEESKQAVAEEQLEFLSTCGESASEKNGGKITVKRAEHSERQAEETGQALADNDNNKESGDAERETSSLETSEENQSLGDNLEEERDKRQLRSKGSSNNQNIAKLGQDSEIKIEQEHLQPQTEGRVQRELSKSENYNETPLERSQSLEHEGSKDVNAEQQVSLSESAEEQYEPLTEERETSNLVSSETVDEIRRENRDTGKQDRSKMKCCRNKNPSLANENYPETAEVASEAETDTQSSLEEDKLSAEGESAVMAPQETEGEGSVEEYQELEPNSEDAGGGELQPEQENGKE